jgi:hypothetical protein
MGVRITRVKPSQPRGFLNEGKSQVRSSLGRTHHRSRSRRREVPPDISQACLALLVDVFVHIVGVLDSLARLVEPAAVFKA